MNKNDFLNSLLKEMEKNKIPRFSLNKEELKKLEEITKELSKKFLGVEKYE